MIREFRLSPRGRGVSCDADGAFVGAVPLLQRFGPDRWEPRDCGELSKQLSSDFGLPLDLSSRTGGLTVIANALNEGNIARAQIATVLLGIPDPPLTKETNSSEETIRLIGDLYLSGLIKWDEDGASTASANLSNSLDPHDVETALTKTGYNPDEPRDERGRWTTGSWDELVSRLSDEAQSVLTQVGQSAVDEGEADRTASTVMVDTIVGDLETYANYRAKPWIGPDGLPLQVPAFTTGDPFADRATRIGHDIFAPNVPFTRPATNADWIDGLAELGSAATSVVGPAFDAAGIGARAIADTVEFAPDAPFIIPPSELPAGWDITRPVGRYVIPTDVVPGPKYGILAHIRIGQQLRNEYSEMEVILRTANGARGVDVEIPEEYVSKVGFRYAEIKPVSKYGFRSFNRQVARWKKPEPVLAITYDYKGNIYYGFPW